jgi:hypothetical protein
MRMFHGVDLDKNYGGMMWNTYDPKIKRSLALKRQFRGHCLQIEREMRPGMMVIDRASRLYQIIDIKGWGIEEKEYWLQRGHDIVKKSALEIYPFDWWEREKKGNLQAGEKMPLWFRIVDAVLQREAKEWAK